MNLDKMLTQNPGNPDRLAANINACKDMLRKPSNLGRLGTIEKVHVKHPASFYIGRIGRISAYLCLSLHCYDVFLAGHSLD